jgi:1,5-anhydro-D-fructose reductase (1,5-anhydro-D-mannitol-forming)
VTALRWAILGTGWMGSQIAEGIATQPDAELVAVLSRSEERGKAFAGRFGGRPFLDEATLLGARDLDIVYVGTPNALHADQARRAIRAGKHVLCDKPLAFRATDAEAVASEAAAAGVTLSVVFQTRRHPGLEMVRGAIESGSIGVPCLVEVRLSLGAEELAGWRADADLAGAGSLHNLGVHALDTLQCAAGAPIVELSAMQRPKGAALDRTTLVAARCANGVLGTVVVSQELGAEDVSAVLTGTAGTIRWSGWLAPYRTGEVVVSGPGGVDRQPAAAPDIYSRVVRAFQDAVLTGSAPDPTPAEAVASVRIAQAVREGRPWLVEGAR